MKISKRTRKGCMTAVFAPAAAHVASPRTSDLVCRSRLVSGKLSVRHAFRLWVRTDFRRMQFVNVRILADISLLSTVADLDACIAMIRIITLEACHIQWHAQRAPLERSRGS
ncbi:uncharacterized protein L969DRAFT_86290 [Mixia osmundae IAM 14324]|uniref:uncharacterized protein n=1 Tax=Mixia osmundae (strain CBS 9802 / IAM 14324 / JCM 22182 / KY 12970) TaxID=764103 RepID=UPI0004A550F2|nr:uncharacterized protein L969DRAFT_86290 [Mixia osmundae IAM 14324]KEI41038.1 hypothetical protein L969DRAFT_86290 [Mixia osmundae IAM 14324]